jgi:broad specificity phosphatase PhoE
MSKRVLLASVLAVLAAAPAAAQPTVFLVRHAERADAAPGAAPMMSADPDLSDAGRARAESLAMMLEDARITAILSTEFKRAQQTAAPLAKAIGVAVTTVTSRNQADLVTQIKASTGNVLVVGHSNTVPDVIKALGVTTPITIADDEYDNLFLVTRSTPPWFVRLHYK